MVIIDDKPPNFPGVAPPPYAQQQQVRQVGASPSQAGSSTSGSRVPRSHRPPELIVTNPNDETRAAFDSAYGSATANQPGSSVGSSGGGGTRSSKSVASPADSEASLTAFMRRTAADVDHERELQNELEPPPPFPRARVRKTLLDLPQHTLLYIIQLTCLPSRPAQVPAYDEGRYDRSFNPDAKGEYRGNYVPRYGYDYDRGSEDFVDRDDEWAEHAAGLYQLAISVRLVCRGLYVACMHILRSTYLPLYSLNIKPPYTSDPFPASTPTYTITPYTPTSSTAASTYTPANSSPLLTTHRETAVLDRFILLTLHQNLLTSESSLHISSHSSTTSSSSYYANSNSATYTDLFSLHQPTARLEDLVRHYGLQNGSITTAPSSSRLVSFDYVSVKLSDGGRRVGLVISDTKGRKRVVAEYLRENKQEKLEIAAKRLAKELLGILKRSRPG